MPTHPLGYQTVRQAGTAFNARVGRGPRHSIGQALEMESRTVTDPLQIGEALCGESGFEGLGDQCTYPFGVVREYL